MWYKDKAHWYVYELLDSRDNSVFYVGKGRGNRINDHEKEALKGVCSKKCNKINSIIKSGNSIIKNKVASFWCEQAAYDYETDLISFYGLKNLTNIMAGGQRAFERRVKEKLVRVKEQKPIDVIELVNKSKHLIFDWSELTENGKYLVEPVLTGNPLQDAISKMAALVYNKCVRSVLEEACIKSGGELVIGGA